MSELNASSRVPLGTMGVGGSERAERTILLRSVAIAAAVVVTVVNTITALAAPVLAVRMTVLTVVYALASLGLVLAARRGLVRQASIGWILTVWIIASLTAWTGGGLSAPAISIQFIVVLLAGLLLGRRWVVIATFGCMLVMLGMGYAESSGLLPIVSPRPIVFRALTLAGYIAVLGSLTWTAMRGEERLRVMLEREQLGHEEERRLLREAVAIREAYSNVLEAVTGGTLVVMAPEEVAAALGDEVSAERRIEFGKLAETIAWLRAELAAEFTSMSDITLLVDSAGEALANAVKHASGGTYQLYRKGTVAQFRVSDEGPGIEFTNLPKATLSTGFSTAGTLGLGFTVMLRRSDRVLLSTQPGLTTVVIEVDAG